MIKKNDIITLEIEKLLYEGYALGHFEGMAIFVKRACPEDLVEVQITKVNKNYASAKILKIITPSKYRVKPICPLFNACCACHFQFIDYDFLCQEKRNIVAEALRDSAIEPTVKSPIIEKYRHKVQYPASQTKKSKRIISGYFKENSHDITNIKFCPMQPQIINDIIDFIRNNWSLGAYVEKIDKGILKYISIRKSSSTDDILLTLVLNCNKKPDIKYFINKITETFPQIKGIFLNYNTKQNNTILTNIEELVFGKDCIEEKIGNKIFKIGSQSFFQVNPKCAELLFDEVKKNIKENDTILDCYGGVGAMGIYVSDLASHITLIEENANAVKFAKENFELNKIKNYEIIEGKAEDKITDGKKFDCAIIDPPRKGCEKHVLDILHNITDKIIYVSCNPQTLARDINILKEKNFKVKYVKPFDMFPFTYHIECVCLLEKI